VHVAAARSPSPVAAQPEPPQPASVPSPPPAQPQEEEEEEVRPVSTSPEPKHSEPEVAVQPAIRPVSPSPVAEPQPRTQSPPTVASPQSTQPSNTSTIKTKRQEQMEAAAQLYATLVDQKAFGKPSSSNVPSATGPKQPISGPASAAPKKAAFGNPSSGVAKPVKTFPPVATGPKKSPVGIPVNASTSTATAPTPSTPVPVVEVTPSAASSTSQGQSGPSLNVASRLSVVHLAKFQQAFVSNDSDKDGQISITELGRALKSLDYDQFSESDLKEIVASTGVGKNTDSGLFIDQNGFLGVMAECVERASKKEKEASEDREVQRLMNRMAGGPRTNRLSINLGSASSTTTPAGLSKAGHVRLASNSGPAKQPAPAQTRTPVVNASNSTPAAAPKSNPNDLKRFPWLANADD